jgi:2-oxoglutarate ferredoxin oxidoreductase subunit alpha
MTDAKPKGIYMMQGNTACAEGAIAAGCRFFAGYPITPSTEIAEVLASRLPQIGGNFIQMEDEIAAMGAVIGASLGGVKAMTATSGPGFSLKQENIGFAAMAEIPVVIVDVQRGGRAPVCRPTFRRATSCRPAGARMAITALSRFVLRQCAKPTI